MKSELTHIIGSGYIVGKIGCRVRNKGSVISLWYVVWWRDGTTNPEKMHFMKVINDFISI